MQTDKFGDFKYKTTLQCFQDNYREGGLKGFYKGYVICMMRSFPVNAAAVVVYRLMQRLSNVSSHWYPLNLNKWLYLKKTLY